MWNNRLALCRQLACGAASDEGSKSEEANIIWIFIALTEAVYFFSRIRAVEQIWRFFFFFLVFEDVLLCFLICQESSPKAVFGEKIEYLRVFFISESWEPKIKFDTTNFWFFFLNEKNIKVNSRNEIVALGFLKGPSILERSKSGKPEMNRKFSKKNVQLDPSIW